MNPFLERLGEELERAARRRARRPPLARWSRRTLVLALVAVLLVAVPTVTAVTGVFSAKRSAPSLVDAGGPRCGMPTPKPRVTDAPVAPELLRILGVLRRPATPQDRPPHARNASFVANQPVNLDAIRLAQTSSDGVRYYLIPVANVNAERKLPDTPACRALQPPHMRVVPGVYLREEDRGGGGGISRATVDEIERGYTLATSYGEGRDKPGHARAYGLAPDGVTAVTLRLGLHDRRSITVPVKNNVFQTTFKGHAGANIRLYFHTAEGVTPVGPKPPSRAARRRQHAAARREHARDLAATATARITPAAGTPHTVFTVRMRVAHPTSRGEYLVALHGPKGGGCASSDRIGVLPAQAGALRGLVKASLGFPRTLPGWCRGSWRGTIEARAGHRVVGRLRFRVR